jgi:hypothetical protein
LGNEIAKAIQRCAVPESQIDVNERFQNAWMMGVIQKLNNDLTARARRASSSYNSTNSRGSNSSRDSALLTLFHKTIITSMNLQALLSMYDPQIRIGDVRCKSLPSSTS